MTTNPNFLKFEKESVKSEMPYFGRTFSGIGYGGGNGGLYFKGKIQDYSLTKDKKSYLIKAKIQDKTESYNII